MASNACRHVEGDDYLRAHVAGENPASWMASARRCAAVPRVARASAFTASPASADQRPALWRFEARCGRPVLPGRDHGVPLIAPVSATERKHA